MKKFVPEYHEELEFNIGKWIVTVDVLSNQDKEFVCEIKSIILDPDIGHLSYAEEISEDLIRAEVKQYLEDEGII